MSTNSAIPIPENKMKIVWGLLVVAAIGIIASPGIQDFRRGAPVDTWIVDVTLAALLGVLYFGTRLAYWLEGDQPSNAEFLLSDWTILAVTGLWILASAFFVAIGRTSIGVIGYLIFGGIGFLTMLYRLYKARRSPPRARL